jgi:osmotically-inducible protein OsmY
MGFFGGNQKHKPMKTDIQIQKDVQAELKWRPFLKSNEIGVAVKNGIVTLSGTVDTYLKKREAESAARMVEGVKAVAEDIVVRHTPDQTTNDSDLAAAVVNALKWHSAVADDKIRIKVEEGWVTLEGTAEYGFQKEAAETAVTNLKGVAGVNNYITITTAVEPRDVKKQILEAFHRAATLDSKNIIIDTIGDKVELKGKVRSLAESRDAEKAAWLAPGVRQVINKLEIETGVFA